MNKHNPRLLWLIIPITLVVILDEVIKFIALKKLPDEGSLVDPGIIDFAIHRNFGIAFDIPFKIPVIIIISVIIGLFLFKVVKKNWKSHPGVALSALTIIIGAMGNLYDRIVYQFTVDYIILFGRLAINLSDVIIVGGVIWLLMASRKIKKQKHELPHPPIRG